MTEREPFVSVIVPSFNARSSIRRAVDSALAQSGAPLEVVIIDDSSTDGTPDLVRCYYASEPRVRVHCLEENRGPAFARNLGIREARGTWIGLLDADDAWRETRIASLLPHLQSSCAAVFDNLVGYDLVGACETGILFPYLPDEMSPEMLLKPRAAGSSFNYGYMKPLIRKNFLIERGLAYEENLRISEDLILYLRLLLEGAKTHMVADAYYLYTTPIGLNSGRASPASRSVPDDAAVSRMLEEIAAQYAGRLSESTEEALRARIAFMREEGPMALFYHAYVHGDVPRLIQIAWQEPRVRQQLVRRLLGRINRNADRNR